MDGVRSSYIVETVAILQVFQLGLKDIVHCRTEIATKRHSLLGHAADPEINLVEASGYYSLTVRDPSAVAEQEIHRVDGWCHERGTKTVIYAIRCRIRPQSSDDGTSCQSFADLRRLICD